MAAPSSSPERHKKRGPCCDTRSVHMLRSCQHQLAEFLATVKMHATTFIELSLLLVQHIQHTDPSTNAATAAREEASCEEI